MSSRSSIAKGRCLPLAPPPAPERTDLGALLPPMGVPANEPAEAGCEWGVPAVDDNEGA